jgi:hypothetical protein
MAAGDFTTLTNLKQYLPIPTANTNDDALLSRMISAGSAFIVSFLKRDIVQAEYTDLLNGNGSNRMFMRQYPVTAVSALTIHGRTIPPSPQPGVRPGYWNDNNMLYLQEYCFPLGFGNVSVSYTAGYAIIPLDLEQVCIELVMNKYLRRDRMGQDSKSVGGEVVSFSKVDLSIDHTELLEKYTCVVPAW